MSSSGIKNPVRTSQETHYVSSTKPNRLMLFGETVAVYCENHRETDTFWAECGALEGNRILAIILRKGK
jgi:hypothetical protein